MAASTNRSTRWSPRDVLITLAGVAIAIFVAINLYGPRATAIMEVSRTGPTAVDLVVDSCNGRPQVASVEVEADGQRVVVEVSSENRSTNECQDLLPFTLPVDTATELVDDKTGTVFSLE